MTVDNIDVEATIKSVQERLAQEPNLSPALRSTLDVLLVVVQFRSKEGADIFCRVRRYLSTCRKNNVSATNALELLFEGKLPDFML